MAAEDPTQHLPKRPLSHPHSLHHPHTGHVPHPHTPSYPQDENWSFIASWLMEALPRMSKTSPMSRSSTEKLQKRLKCLFLRYQVSKPPSAMFIIMCLYTSAKINGCLKLILGFRLLCVHTDIAVYCSTIFGGTVAPSFIDFEFQYNVRPID